MNLLDVPPTTNLLDVSPPTNLTLVTGPTLVGTTLNWYLYGVLTVQYFLYLMYSRNDRLAMKLIVHLLFALDTLQTILTIDDLFFWFVYNFGDTEKVLQFHWAFDIPTLDAIVGFLVQIVYCWRIWVLSGWRVIPAVSALISLVATGAGFAAGIRFQLQKVPEISSATQAPMLLWLFGSAAVDVVLAGSMTYVLLRQRKDLFIEKSTTAERIMRILTLTLETNAITAAVAVVSIVLFFDKSVEPPATNFYQLGGYILGKLYSNCFMILLNQRHHKIHTRGQSSRSDSSGFNIEFGPGPGLRNSNQPRNLGGVSGPQMRYPVPPKVRVLISEDRYEDR